MGEPYRFTGPQGTARKYSGNKGVMRQYREILRHEAEERQARFLKGESLNPYRESDEAEQV